jgi:hypothetical protein
MFLRGYFTQGDERYFIEPLRPTNQDEQEHALFKDDPNEDKANGTCGTDDVLGVHGSHQDLALSATRLIVCTLLFFTCASEMYPAQGSSLSSVNDLPFSSHC